MSDSLHSKKSLFTEENSQNKKTNLERSESRIFQVEAVRKDFPVLRQTVNGKPLVWLDNAATTQKPQSVIDSISDFYENYNSNIHRGAHTLAAHATEAYENAREKVRRLINASSKDEIIYVRGTTEGINLISNTFGKQQVGRELFEKYRRRYSPYGSVASLYLWAVAGGAVPELRDYAPQGKKGAK